MYHAANFASLRQATPTLALASRGKPHPGWRASTLPQVRQPLVVLASEKKFAL